nr:hypothetical protein PRUPE_7G210000 [Ipomoea batatas]GME03881.1 hypothetical protein PRUPE_7G210000 [Ipomoea batatas]
MMVDHLSSMGRGGFSSLALFTTQEALLRCGQVLYKRLKMGAWMLYRLMFFGMGMNPLLENIILKGDMIWLSSSNWLRKQGFMFISALAHTFVENGILGDSLFG